MKTRIKTVLSRIQEVGIIKKQIQKDSDNLEKEIDHLNSEIKILDKVVELFKHLLDELIVDNVKRVDNLVTYGLKVAFPDQNLEFKAKVKPGKGKIGVEFETIKDGKIVGETVETFGGSITVVESFLLRLIVIIKLALRRVLVLDESFDAVDPEYSSNVSKLLQEMCEKLGFDILLVTHNRTTLPEFAHHVYKAIGDEETDCTKVVKVK